jgi:hypothetical protein
VVRLEDCSFGQLVKQWMILSWDNLYDLEWADEHPYWLFHSWRSARWGWWGFRVERGIQKHNGQAL